MSTQISYFKLGLFVVVATLGLCAGVIVLGAGKLFERTITIETYMTESVEGINKGSAVKYQGIELGQVSKVMIAAKKYDPNVMKEGRFGSAVLLELAIREDALNNPEKSTLDTWLQKAVAGGLRARTASSGLTGPAFVELVFLNPTKFPAPAITWTPPALYIPSAPSTTQMLISAVQGILSEFDSINFKGVATNLDDLLLTAKSKLDDIDMKKLDQEAVAFLEEIRGTNDRLKQILDNPAIDPSIEDLRSALQNAKRASARMVEILDDPRIDAILTDVDEAGSELKPALQDFRRIARRIDLLIASQQAAIESIISELDRTLENVRAITEDATQNPSRMLFGDPPPHLKNGNDQ